MSELPWLRSLVKHNVAAKHGSSKPLTSELWLIELRIKSTRILASIPDALWDMCKMSIKENEIIVLTLVFQKGGAVTPLTVCRRLYQNAK